MTTRALQHLAVLAILVAGVALVSAAARAPAPGLAATVDLERRARLEAAAAFTETAVPRETGANGRVQPVGLGFRVRSASRRLQEPLVPEALVVLLATVGCAFGSALLSVVPALRQVGRARRTVTHQQQLAR